MGKTPAVRACRCRSASPPTPEPRLSGCSRALVVVAHPRAGLQVYGDLANAAKYLPPARARAGGRAAVIYGGRPYEPQIEALQKGVDVVVRHPGAARSTWPSRPPAARQVSVRCQGARRGPTKCSTSASCPTSSGSCKQIPDERQAMLFSATHARPDHHAGPHVHEPAHAYPGWRGRRTRRPCTTPPGAVRLPRLRGWTRWNWCPVPCGGQRPRRDDDLHAHQRTAQKVSDELAERGFKVGRGTRLISARPRAQKSLKAFRYRRSTCSSPPTSRPRASTSTTSPPRHQLPDPRGRAGLRAPHRPHGPRAARPASRVPLVDWDELARWEMIDKALGLACPHPAETYSSSPHLYEELDIPTDAKGTVGEPRKVTGQARAAAETSPPISPPAAGLATAGALAAGSRAAGTPRRPAEQAEPAAGRRVRRGRIARAGAVVAVARARPRPRAPG